MGMGVYALNVRIDAQPSTLYCQNVYEYQTMVLSFVKASSAKCWRIKEPALSYYHRVIVLFMQSAKRHHGKKLFIKFSPY